MPERSITDPVSPVTGISHFEKIVDTMLRVCQGVVKCKKLGKRD
jgi:hypothetical protein